MLRPAIDKFLLYWLTLSLGLSPYHPITVSAQPDDWDFENIEWITVSMAPVITALNANKYKWKNEDYWQALKRHTENNKEELVLYLGVLGGSIVISQLARTNSGDLHRRADLVDGRRPERILLIGGLGEETEALQELYPSAKIDAELHTANSDEILVGLKSRHQQIQSGERLRYDTVVVVGHGAPGSNIRTPKNGGKYSAFSHDFLQEMVDLDLTTENASLRLVSCGSASSCPLIGSGRQYLREFGRAFLKEGGRIHGTRYTTFTDAEESRSILSKLNPLQITRTQLNKMRNSQLAPAEILRIISPTTITALEVGAAFWFGNPFQKVRTIKISQGEIAQNCLIRTLRNLAGI